MYKTITANIAVQAIKFSDGDVLNEGDSFHNIKIKTMPPESPTDVDVGHYCYNNRGLDNLSESDTVMKDELSDLESGENFDSSEPSSFRSLRPSGGSQSSFGSFASAGRFSSRWRSFKSAKSGLSLTSFKSARWDVFDSFTGDREVARVVPLSRQPELIDDKMEKLIEGKDCTFLATISAAILIVLLSAAIVLGLYL